MSVAGLTLPEIERLARQAREVPALALSMANDAWGLLAYRQALILCKSDGGWHALSLSGSHVAQEATPYQRWLCRVASHLEKTAPTPGGIEQVPLLWLTPQDLPEALARHWEQWWPREAVYFYLRNRGGTVNGLAFYLFDAAATATRMASLSRLAEVWIHAWAMLSAATRRGWIPGKRTRVLFAGAVVAVLLAPVRESVLAPGEIVSLESSVLSAPVEGVIREMLVRPHQLVTAGQPVAAMDGTALRSRRELLTRSAQSTQAVRRAELQAELEAELEDIDRRLQRLTLAAPRAGVAVFEDPDNWRGRPVAAGERVMLIADPAAVGVRIHVPVQNAINIEEGTPVRVFLNTSPLSPLDAEVVEAGRGALASPGDASSYPVHARLAGHVTPPRIGLRATAKLYGSRVALGYWILRRPLATARDWLGP